MVLRQLKLFDDNTTLDTIKTENRKLRFSEISEELKKRIIKEVKSNVPKIQISKKYNIPLDVQQKIRFEVLSGKTKKEVARNM
jgi:hypothetical protein